MVSDSNIEAKKGQFSKELSDVSKFYEAIKKKNYKSVLKSTGINKLDNPFLKYALLNYQGQVELGAEVKALEVYRGLHYLTLGNFERAKSIFINAIKFNKKDIYVAHFGLGIIYSVTEKYSLSENHYKKSLKSNSEYYPSLLSLASLKNINGEPLKAISIISKLPIKLKMNRAVQDVQLTALIQMKEWESILKVLWLRKDKAGLKDRDKAIVARCYIELGQYSLAKRTLAEIADPEYIAEIGAHFVLNYLEKGDLESAESWFEALPKGNDSKYANLYSEVLIYKKQYQKAEFVLRKYVKFKGSFILWTKAKILSRQYDGLLERIKSENLSVASLKDLAKIALENESFKLASELYSLALVQAPDSLELLNNTAWSLYKISSPEAYEIALKAFNMAKGNESVIHTYTSVLLAERKYEQCRLVLSPHFESGLMFKPALFENLALAYEKLNMFTSSIKVYKALKKHLAASGSSVKSLAELNEKIEEIESRFKER